MDQGRSTGRGSRPVYPHGTLASYCHGACRCNACREANTVYHRELRKRLRARLDAPDAQVPHGTAGGYANHGCRCRACSNAHRDAMAASYARRRAAAQETSPEFALKGEECGVALAPFDLRGSPWKQA